jgi:2'-5' RNA ligase
VTPFSRSFIALAVPEAARDRLVELTSALARRAVPRAPRLIVADQLQVTLKFIGRIEAARAEALGRALASLAEDCPAIRAELAEVTAFPTPARARVIVARLGDADGHLQRLAASVEAWTSSFGIPVKARELVPYVSLARLRLSTDVRPWLTPKHTLDEAIHLGELELHAAEPSPPGSIYRVLARVALRPAEPAR